MSQENVELARAALDWFAQLDEGLVGPERWGEFFTHDALATFSGFGVMDEQMFRGLEFLVPGAWMEPYDDWLYEPKEILDAERAARSCGRRSTSEAGRTAATRGSRWTTGWSIRSSGD